MYCESYKVEFYFFPDILKKEAGLPMLIVESEYHAMETGTLKTRIETFIGTIRR
jgi:benzoyl-CoA reductase/2-hydroxyglutaryl-CoA dehydratase subunit BcrC/BadD/HgdB